MSSPESRPRGIFIHAKPAYLDVWPIPPRLFNDQSAESSPLQSCSGSFGSGSTEGPIFTMSGFFLLQLACLVGRSPDVRRRRLRPIKIRVFVPTSDAFLNITIKKRVNEVLQGLRIEVSFMVDSYIFVKKFMTFCALIGRLYSCFTKFSSVNS